MEATHQACGLKRGGGQQSAMRTDARDGGTKFRNVKKPELREHSRGKTCMIA